MRRRRRQNENKNIGKETLDDLECNTQWQTQQMYF
jgi:hypothetical protein